MGTLLTGEFNRRRAEDEKRRDEERRKAENRDELRKNLLERLNRTYFDFKRAKRLLRAKAFTPPYYGMLNQEATVNLEQYDEQLEILNDAQLELEHIAKDVEANHMLFEHSKEIAAAIRVMEESLKQVVTEWERKRGNLDGKNPPKISDLPCLKAVVGPGYQAEVNRELWGGYQKAARYIQQGILEPNE